VTLPLLSKSHPDIQTAQRRIAETVNNVLTFQHDDSRIRTAAEISAGITALNPAFSNGRPWIEIERHGAVLDGVTSDHGAFNRAMTVASISGGVVHIPAGSMAIDSAQLPLTVYSNTAIVGDGKDLTKIVLTGTGTGHFFKGTNVKGFHARGLNLTGTGQGTAIDQAAAFNFQQDSSATQVGGNICIEDCAFTNFTAYYWLWFRNTGSTYTMDNIWVRNNVFTSSPGNTISPSSIVPSAYMVSFEGQNNGSAGILRNAWVQNNYAECTNVRCFGVAWESTRNIYFTHNICPNAGQANSNDAANYAFLVYNAGTIGPNPDYIYIENNIVAAPRDCGVYSALHDTTGGHVFIRRNVFTGQTSTATGTLPKGAIALNGTNFAVVEDNYVDSCYWGIAVIGQYTSQVLFCRRNTVTACTSQSIYFQATLTGSVAYVEISDNYASASAANVRGIYVDVTSAAGVSALKVDRNYASSAFEPIEVSSRSGTALLGEVSISHNECNGQSASGGGLVAASLSNTNTRTRIFGNRFTGTWGNVALLQITSSINLSVLWNEFHDINGGSQYCITANGARGRLEGNRFINVTNAQIIFVSGGEDLGRSTPTWTGANNDFIENLVPTETGAASSKYMKTGWQWDATGAAWRERRCLTGN